MINKLMATTAVLTLLASGAFAQDTTTAAPASGAAQTDAMPAQGQNAAGDMAADTTQQNGFLASNLIGENVYNGVIQTGQAAQSAAQNAEAQNGQTAQTNADGMANGQTAQDGQNMMTGDGQTAQNGAATDANGQNTQMSQDGQEAIQTAETIGDVNDLVIGKDGKVDAIVVGVGGFLGIGEKDVALDFSKIQWARGQDGDPYIVVNATRESLEALPEFDRSQYGQAVNRSASASTTNGGMAPADGGAGTMAATGAATGAAVGAAADNAADATVKGANQAGQAVDNAADATAQTARNAGAAVDNAAGAATDTTQTGAIDRSQLQEIPQNQLTAETLVGTTVYGANDENVGEIGDIVLTQDGKVDAVLVDVGGFLGIGEKRVAIGMDKLKFLQDGNGNRYLYTNFSEDQLKAQAAYDEGSYSQNRDQQRLIVQ